uniref:Uncharacterized protein n=1 Tax=Molossus molossus TaxID=27622 RepID=A0A7J8E2E1_MOLMO|nr:hypothetical protein HJG59_008956 [Molossus molossus]
MPACSAAGPSRPSPSSDGPPPPPGFCELPLPDPAPSHPPAPSTASRRESGSSLHPQETPQLSEPVKPCLVLPLFRVAGTCRTSRTRILHSAVILRLALPPPASYWFSVPGARHAGLAAGPRRCPSAQGSNKRLLYDGHANQQTAMYSKRNLEFSFCRV